MWEWLGEVRMSVSVTPVPCEQGWILAAEVGDGGTLASITKTGEAEWPMAGNARGREVAAERVRLRRCSLCEIRGKERELERREAAGERELAARLGWRAPARSVPMDRCARGVPWPRLCPALR